MNVTLWLCLTLVTAALWSGLLLTITTILHPMFASQGASGLRHDLGRFLPIARRSPTNYVLVVGLMVAPAMTVSALWDSRSEAPFILVAIGCSLTFLGAFALSRFAAEPNYDVILDDDLASDSDRWQQARRRYFQLNWIRGVLVWSALACFTVSAIQYWSQ